MNKFMLVVFGLLTVGAGYATFYDLGVEEPTLKSVREGSTGHRARGSGYGYGK